MPPLAFAALAAVLPALCAAVTWTHASHNVSVSLGARVAAAVGTDGVAFFGGSFPNKKLSTQVDLYNLTTKAWSILPKLPHGHAGSSTLGGYLSKVGISFAYGGDNTIDLLQTSSKTWLPNLQTKLTHEFSACAGNADTIVCAGGQGSNKKDKDVPSATDVFVLGADGKATLHDTSYKLSVGRKKLSAAAAGDLIGFAMGYSDNRAHDDFEDAADDESSRRRRRKTPSGPKGYSAAFDVYNISSKTWSHGTLPSKVGRQYGTAVGCGGKLIWAGGQLGGRSDTVDILDSKTGAWSTSNLTVARSNLGAACAGDRFALFGGGQIPARGTVDAFDTVTGTWSVLEDLTVPRGWVSGAGAGSCALFGGGETVDIYCFSDTEDIVIV